MANTNVNINPYGQGNAVLPTTSSPIADNLTTDSDEFALSARQGVVLKGMINQSGGGSADAQPVDQIAWLKACRMRMDHMLNTKWRPVINMPRTYVSTASEYFYYPSSDSKGMPYSNTREIDKYIGWNVSLYTFLTAVHNRYSLLYTENISTAHSRSSYEKTYHGTSNESATYYGVHCSVMAAYVLGLPCYWLTRHYDYAASEGFFTSLGRPVSSNVKLFDVIWTNGHVRFVTDIKHNADGTISTIHVSESVVSLPTTTSYTPTTFDSTFNTSSYKMYRPTNSGLSTEYQDLSDIQYNDDICTIAGDKAVFRAGDTIGINYTITSGSGYTKMLIKRNGNTVKTVTGLTANNESTTLTDHLVDLTSDNLECGMYTAILSNSDGTVVSDATHFEVIDTSVVCSISGSNAKISFSSLGGTPVYVDFVSAEYHTAARKLLTEEERLLGTATINAQTLWASQKTYYTYTDSLSNLKVKVLFKGEYGMVASELVATSLTFVK